MCWRVTKINTAHFGSEFLAMTFLYSDLPDNPISRLTLSNGNEQTKGKESIECPFVSGSRVEASR